MKKIVLIGAGHLGSRHLQGLAKIDIPVSLHVIDPSLDSLQIAQERYFEVPINENIYSISFKTALNDLEDEFDLCIVATTSDIRLDVIKDLLSKKKVHYLLLEKVLFQRSEDFEEAKILLNNKGVKTWVNCVRRAVPLYQNLKKYFQKNDLIEYKVSGRNWGIGSNSIHFIDHMAYYANELSYEVDIEGLDQYIWPSNKEGFSEFTGILNVRFSSGSGLVMESRSNGDFSVFISITSSKTKVDIDEVSGKVKIFRKENNWSDKEVFFRIPYQSELTHIVAKQILETGTTCLTPFDESSKLHIPLIKALKEHVEMVENRQCVCCPIT